MLRVQLSRLRQALLVAGEDVRLSACRPGNLLRVDEGELELHASERPQIHQRDALESVAPAERGLEQWRELRLRLK